MRGICFLCGVDGGLGVGGMRERCIYIHTHVHTLSLTFASTKSSRSKATAVGASSSAPTCCRCPERRRRRMPTWEEPDEKDEKDEEEEEAEEEEAAGRVRGRVVVLMLLLVFGVSRFWLVGDVITFICLSSYPTCAHSHKPTTHAPFLLLLLLHPITTIPQRPPRPHGRRERGGARRRHWRRRHCGRC